MTDENNTPAYPQTYQAFADVLCSYQQNLFSELRHLEKRIQTQGNKASITHYDYEVL